MLHSTNLNHVLKVISLKDSKTDTAEASLPSADNAPPDSTKLVYQEVNGFPINLVECSLMIKDSMREAHALKKLRLLVSKKRSQNE